MGDRLTEALAKLYAAGRIKSPWLPGMLSLTSGRHFRYVGRGYGTWVTGVGSYGDAVRGEPDLTDPATVGCLLALLREAENDPGATTCSPELGDADHNWYVHLPIEGAWATDSGAPTEGEAIAAALIALAEAP